MLKPNDCIIQRYSVETLLGQGGMGSVYLCYDKQLERRVAVKCVKKDSYDPEQREKLTNEAKILAKLNHENIVQLYDIVEHKNEIALVMEYVQGMTLAQQLKIKKLSITAGLYFFRQLCAAVYVAHERGIIHKDLKAENILITEKERIKVTDFGIAGFAHDSNTPHGSSMGSYASLSPEQARGEALDHRTDIFSLGILAYQLFVHQHPFFNARNPVEFIQSLTTETPLRLREHNRSIPKKLCQLVAKMLEKNTRHRPSSLQEVLKCADELISDLPDEADDYEASTHVLTQLIAPQTPISGRYSTWANWVNKKKWLGLKTLLAMAGISAIVATGILALTVFNQDAERQYIGILEARLNFEHSIDNPDYQSYLIVQDAIESAVLESDTLALIPRSDFASINGNTKAVGNALAADQLLAIDIKCGSISCNVGLSLVNAASGTTVRKESWPILKNDTFNIYASAQAKLSKLIGVTLGDTNLAEKINEQNYLDYIKLYESYYRVDTHNEALLRDIETLVMSNPKYLPLYHLYTRAAIEEYSNTHEKRHLSKLEEVLLQAERLSPYHNIKLLNWFEFYLASKNYEKSKQHIILLQQNGYPRDKLVELEAMLDLEQGNYNNAISLYKQSISLRPNINTLNRLAQLQWLNGDNTGAKHTLAEVFSLSPNDYRANSLSAAIATVTGDLDAAISSYTRLVEHHKSSHNHSDLGVAYLLKSDLDSAKREFEEALRLAPNNLTYILNLADTEKLLQNTDRASALYNTVLTLSREYQLNLEQQLSVAQALAHTGQNLEAIAKMQSIMAQYASNPSVLFTAALVYTLLQEHQSALVYFERATDLGLGEIWFNLPWFAPLCQYPQFSERLTSAGSVNRCKNDISSNKSHFHHGSLRMVSVGSEYVSILTSFSSK